MITKQTTITDTSTGEILSDKTRPVDKNTDFVQVYRKFIYQMSCLGVDNPTAATVLFFIMREMDANNALVMTQTLMAKCLKISRVTLKRALDFLCDNGWLCRIDQDRMAIWVVNPAVVWTSYNKDKSRCRFSATVVLEADDQWNQQQLLKNYKISYDKSHKAFTNFAKLFDDTDNNNNTSASPSISKHGNEIPGQMDISDFGITDQQEVAQ